MSPEISLHTSWAEIASIVSLVGIFGTLLFVLGRDFLRPTFAPRPDLRKLEERLHAVEKRLQLMPTEHDMSAALARITEIERGVSRMAAAFARVDEGIQGVRRTVDLLLRHQLGEKADGLP